MRYLLAAAALLLVVLVAVFVIVPPETAPSDPKVKQLSDLVGLAERMCLSNTTSEQTAAIKLKLDLISKQVAGDTSVSRGREALRGAADSLAETLKKAENDDIRKCMEPWSEQIRALAKSFG